MRDSFSLGEAAKRRTHVHTYTGNGQLFNLAFNLLTHDKRRKIVRQMHHKVSGASEL